MSKDKIETIFKESEKAFLAEATRKANLTDKAEKYLAAVGVIVGFSVIKFERLSFVGSSRERFFSIFAVGAFVFLGAAILLILQSMRVKDYATYPRGEILLDELKDEKITNEMAKIKLAKMYLAAHDTNARINDRRAQLVSWSGVLLTIGFILSIVSQAFLYFP